MESSFKLTSSEKSEKEAAQNKTKGQYGFRHAILGVAVLFLLLIVVVSFSDNKTTTNNQPIQTETIPQTNQEATNANQPKDLGKWYGESNVSVGKTNTGYLATFEPSLPKGSIFIPPKPDSFKGAGIYAYMIGLANYAYGDNKLSPLNPSTAKPQFVQGNDGATLIAYNTGDGQNIYFLPMKDEESQQVFGMSFWKQ